MSCKLHKSISCNACRPSSACRSCQKKQMHVRKRCAACILTKQPPIKRMLPPQDLTGAIIAYSYCTTAARQPHACARHANEMANCRKCILGNALMKLTFTLTCCNQHRAIIQSCRHCFLKVRNYKSTDILQSKIMQKTKFKHKQNQLRWQNRNKTVSAVAASHDSENSSLIST